MAGAAKPTDTMNTQQKVEFMKEMIDQFSSGDGVKDAKKSSGLAKFITIFIIILITAIGIFGCFIPTIFSMASYALFLEKFAWIFLPLLVSIGANTGIKKVISNNKVKGK